MPCQVRRNVLAETTNFLTSDWSDQYLVESVAIETIKGERVVVEVNRHVSDLLGFELALDAYPQYKAVTVNAS